MKKNQHTNLAPTQPAFAAPAFFKKGNATAALAAGLLPNKNASLMAGLGLPPKNATLAAALAALPGNGTLRAKLKRRAAGTANGGASIEAAGTSVTPGGTPARIGTVVADASITATASTPYVWGATTQVTITGANFSPTAAENTVAFNLGAAGTVTAATTTSLTVQMTAQPTDLGALQATVAVYGYTTTFTTVATVVPTITQSAASLSQQAASVTILGAGFSQNVSPTVVFNLGATAGTVTYVNASAISVAFATQPTSFAALTAQVSNSGVRG